MSKGARWGLVALAVAVVVVAFAIARPDDDDGDDRAAGTVTAETQTETSPTATAPSAPKPPPDGPDAARTARFELVDHVLQGDVENIEVEKGDRVRLIVRSDLPDDIHVHGYDIEQPVGPGTPLTFTFRADIEGIFEIESHEAEHAGKDALLGRLVVGPS
jgi:FtsP/CotA-like multicopper oxidase with cupredoxin domain